MEDNVLTPVNPALAFVIGDNTISNSTDPEKALGLSQGRAENVIEELDAAKKVMFGNRDQLELTEIFEVMSHVARTPQELMYMAFVTGKFIAKNIGYE